VDSAYHYPNLRKGYIEVEILHSLNLLVRRGILLSASKGFMMSYWSLLGVGRQHYGVLIIFFFTLVANYDHYTIRKRPNGIEVFDFENTNIQLIDS
jgi:hypothetical protein